MKKKFREMNDQMQEEQMKRQGFNQQSGTQQSPPKARSEDYIDFEEIK